MKLLILGLLIVIILPFISQTLLRRVFNNARLAKLHSLFDEVTSSQAEVVTGEVQGRRHGRLMGVSFIGGAAGIGKRNKPDAKSSVEFWAECSGTATFHIRGSSGVLFDREFEASSSQPERFALLRENNDFAAALAALTAAGAESLIFPGRGRISAIFRPFRRELLSAGVAGQVMDGMERIANAIESMP